MTTSGPSDAVEITVEFAAEVVHRLAEDRAVRRPVPGGRLSIDRPLPFLCVQRHAAGVDPQVAGLVRGQASYLTVSSDAALAGAVGRLIAGIGGAMSDRFGAFLVIEVWPGPQAPCFRVLAPPTTPASTVPALADALAHVDVLGERAEVAMVGEQQPTPRGLEPLLTSADQRRLGVLLLGLEVPSFFVGESGEQRPLVLRRLQRELTRALQRAVFDFTTVQTSAGAQDFRALGARRLLRATRRADRALADLCPRIGYLLAVTPVNVDDAWQQFRAGGFREAPTFRYRPLEVDPDLLRRDLHGIRLDLVDDPTFGALFRAKRVELDRQLSLVEDRDSPAFVHTSMQLFGGADDELLALAHAILDRAPGWRESDERAGASVGCRELARRATQELDAYREVGAGLEATVEIRDDVPGVLVADDHLLIGSSVGIDARRLEAVVQHEVGTHLLTAANGRMQPLQLLRAGLPGYEETQEAVAVLAELLAGGLTAGRLATLAARVVAVDRMVHGAAFPEVFAELHERFGLGERRTFTMAVRVFRGGGLTKDVVYLRGFHRLLAFLSGGGTLDTLLVGKLALDQVPIIEELQWREIVTPARIRPRWLDLPDAEPRLTRIAAGVGLLDLVEEALG